MGGCSVPSLLARSAGRLLVFALIVSGLSNTAWAIQAPELDPASASSALALVIGAGLLAYDKLRQR
jgi:hypothetical protein